MRHYSESSLNTVVKKSNHKPRRSTFNFSNSPDNKSNKKLSNVSVQGYIPDDRKDVLQKLQNIKTPPELIKVF